ncbi:response regulator [Desulfospira joergensenii]|uniref:response regulator n=1 Tax=Desulfospira joergensenii TaxID=53329 RepID=UPI0003B40584|nr:response regulator [Desulfospira joergensenii]
MKKQAIFSFLLFVLAFTLFLPVKVLARDYIMEFLEENYKEIQEDFSRTPLIYHSIQVRTSAGPKLLILKGDDQGRYRQWLRQYIARNKKFIAKVEDDDNDNFISSKAYEIEVTRLHPFEGRKWPYGGDIDDADGTVLLGDRYVLVIDSNDTRARLISSVIEKMGYTPMVALNGKQALSAFKNQPGKFKLIIANHKAPGMRSGKFIHRILKIDHLIPILVETGYQNDTVRKELLSLFSGAGSVLLKPVVLQDLQNTIKTLVMEEG